MKTMSDKYIPTWEREFDRWETEPDVFDSVDDELTDDEIEEVEIEELSDDEIDSLLNLFDDWNVRFVHAPPRRNVRFTINVKNSRTLPKFFKGKTLQLRPQIFVGFWLEILRYVWNTGITY